MRHHALFFADRMVSLSYRVAFFLPIVLVTLYPTDAYPALASKLCIVLVFTVTAGFGRNRVECLAALLILGLLYGSVFWSVSPSLSLSGAIQATYYVLLFVILRNAAFSPRALIWGGRMLVLVSLPILIYASEQLLFGYDIPATEAPIVGEWMTALGGRVFSRFALPSQLAAYLLMLLPLNLCLLLRERLMGLKLFWGAVGLLNGIIFFYTKSFGAWLSLIGLVVIGGYLFISGKRAISWRTVFEGSVLLFFGSWALLYLIGTLRGQYLWDLQGNNPLWYRFLNWQTAIRIFGAQPFLGTGFFTFGKMYPHYMLPGANESQYAHNSYLQVGAELGLIGLVMAGWLVGRWWAAVMPRLTTLRRTHVRTPASENQDAAYFGGSCFFGGLAFLFHNLIDFDFYVFPLGVLGVALLALAVNVFSPPRADIRRSRPQKNFLRTFAGFGAILCLLLTMYCIDWQALQGKQHQAQAVAFARARRYAEAATQIRQALEATPAVAEYLALEGNIFLQRQQADSARPRFQAAIRHEPETPWFHAGLAEAYLAEQNMSLAYVESRQAAVLFPQRGAYQARLQEMAELFATVSAAATKKRLPQTR